MRPPTHPAAQTRTGTGRPALRERGSPAQPVLRPPGRGCAGRPAGDQRGQPDGRRNRQDPARGLDRPASARRRAAARRWSAAATAAAPAAVRSSVSAGRGPLCDPARCGDEPYLLARAAPGASWSSSARTASPGPRRRGARGRRRRRSSTTASSTAGWPATSTSCSRRRQPVRQRPAAAGGNAARAVWPGCGAPTSCWSRAAGPDERFAGHRAYRAPLQPLGALVLRAGHRRVGFVEAARTPRPPGRCGRSPSAASASPTRSATTCWRQGVELVDFRVHPDHHRYSRAEIDELRELGAARIDAALVTTEKDLVAAGRRGGAGADRRSSAPCASRPTSMRPRR